MSEIDIRMREYDELTANVKTIHNLRLKLCNGRGTYPDAAEIGAITRIADIRERLKNDKIVSNDECKLIEALDQLKKK
uniref:Uncharacterized protein n=1 Tax=viral metagenome TaxID=1070528 RepID=A0A6C0C7M5_9ZZZZ